MLILTKFQIECYLMKTLALRTQIQDYLVEEIIDIYDDKVTYKVEDFKLDKSVLLSEYNSSKKDIYKKLLTLKHPSIISIDKLFEENQKLYTVSKLSNEIKLEKYLQSNSFSESQINKILNSLFDMMNELKKQKLSIDFQLDNLCVTHDNNIFVDNSLYIIEYSDDEQMIYELGCLMYALMTKRSCEDADELESTQQYSKALCGLVNRMLGIGSNQEFKTLQELYTLVKQGAKYDEASCEPIICKESEINPFSKILSLASIVLIVTFGLYALLSDKKIQEGKEITFLQSLQFHIAGYMDKSEAQYTLGTMYENGYVVDINEKNSLEWYQKSANNENLNAQKYVAYLYQKGKMLPKDIDKAIYWYERALKNGSKDLNYRLGILYLNSDDKAIDYKKSFNYFYKSLESNKSNSQYAVAYMYHNGFGVKKDISKAKIFYEKAADQENKLAIKMLTYLNKKPKKKYAKKKPKPKPKPKVKSTQKYYAQEVQEVPEEYIEPKSISYGRLIDRGEFVEDTKTGLFWQKDGRESGKLNFYQAKKYAKNLYLGGVVGWRVPTAKELETIFPAQELPFINTPYTTKKCCEGEYEWRSYWTSEVDNRLADYAYVYHWYGDGGKNNCYASKNYDYVRCVHD